jgi:hypothetical protein
LNIYINKSEVSFEHTYRKDLENAVKADTHHQICIILISQFAEQRLCPNFSRIKKIALQIASIAIKKIDDIKGYKAWKEHFRKASIPLKGDVARAVVLEKLQSKS